MPKLSARTQAILGGVAAFLAVVAIVASVGIALMLEADDSYDASVPWFDLLVLSPIFPLIGGLIAVKRPGNLVGWALLLPSVELAAGTLLRAYAELAVFARPEDGLPGGVVAAVISAGAWTSLMAGVFLLLLLFPNGRAPSVRWRIVARVVLLLFALTWIGITTSPLPDAPYEEFENPLAFTTATGYLPFVYVLIAPCLLAVVAAAIDLIIRFQRSVGDEREQFKWLGFAAGFLILAMPPAIVGNWIGLAGFPFSLALIALPVSVGIAVLRYRLYDVDLVINRTLVYVPLTAILAGLFVASTTLIRTVFTDLTDLGSDAAIAASTLAVVALLTPLKNSLQALVDRYFKEQPDPLTGVRRLSGQARSVMQVLDRDRFIESMLGELVTGLTAAGGRVELETGGHAITVGERSGEPLLAAIASHGERLGTLSVWRGRATREDAASQALMETAEVLADVITLVPAKGYEDREVEPKAGASEQPEVLPV